MRRLGDLVVMVMAVRVCCKRDGICTRSALGGMVFGRSWTRWETREQLHVSIGLAFMHGKVNRKGKM